MEFLHFLKFRHLKICLFYINHVEKKKVVNPAHALVLLALEDLEQLASY